MPHDFLSAEWFAAVEALPVPELPPGAQQIAMNVVVSGLSGGDLELHLDGGRLVRGRQDGAATTVTVPFPVAKALFIKQDQQAAMQAFMSGHIKVTGDITKLMALSQVTPNAEQQAYAASIVALTSDL